MDAQLNDDPPSPSDDPYNTGPVPTTASGPPPHSIVKTASRPMASQPELNPRSCETCRRRKVKCDKKYPCSNCSKAHIDCIFPAPGRAPRRPRKAPDGELLARLRRLEGVVKCLGVQVDDDTPTTGSTMADVPGREYTQMEGTTFLSDQRPLPTTNTAADRGDSLANDFGRLVVNEGRSRYVNNRFWAAASNEVEDLKGILDESSDDEADCPSPVTDSQLTPSNHGFIFSIASHASEVQSLHPSPELIQEYWRVYVEQCDPLMKMIHVPSMREQILAASYNPGKASKAIQVLLFAVYLAAVTSLTSNECLSMTGESQETIGKRYRYGLEQCLVRAHFLSTDELVVLQAFIIFLICLRKYEDARVIWSLCGLACRMAITMGLHRDGSNFDISPLEVEVRRRTWWQILVLDIRSSEEHGCDPVIIHHEFDTKFPLNIEDEDLDPYMKTPPLEREGITKNSFSLIRYHTARTFARLFGRSGTSSISSHIGSRPEPGQDEKQRWVQECQDLLEEKFFRHCNMQIPLHWVICTVSRLILAKQFLLVYMPFHRFPYGNSLDIATKDRLFAQSIESIEKALVLEEKRKTVKWGWLFKKYSQSHATAFLLSELTRRTQGPLVERAWHAIDQTRVQFWDQNPESKKGPMWKPMAKLEAAARAARERDLALGGNETAQAQVKQENGAASAPLPDDMDLRMSDPDQKSVSREHQPTDDRNAFSLNNGHLSYGQRLTISANLGLSHNYFNNNNMMGSATQTSVPYGTQMSAIPNQWHDMSSNGGPNNNPMGDWYDPNFGATANMDRDSFGMAQQQQPKFTTRDPMVSGSEMPGMQLAEWEEMVREFDWQRMSALGDSWM